MEKTLISLLKEIVSLIKMYGVDAIYWFLVIVYAIGILFPDYALSFLNASNLIVLGIIWLSRKSNGNEIRRDKHEKENKKRLSSNVVVNRNLANLIQETKADRAYIMEYHNGKENPALLPFVYLDMTYEQTARKDMNYISGEYQNMNVSLFQMPVYLAEHYFFAGTTDELIEVDQKIGRRYQDHGTEYCAIMLLRSEGTMIGVLGISYAKVPETITRDEIHSIMAMYAQDISDHLDLSKCSMKDKNKDNDNENE